MHIRQGSRHCSRTAAWRMFLVAGIAVHAGTITAAMAHGATSTLELNLHSLDFVPDVPTEIPADGALLPVGANAIVSRATGAQWDFTGAVSGSSMWVLPKTQGDELYLSIGLEHLDPADFATATLMFTVLGVSGTGGGAAPGVFSMWNNGNVFDSSAPEALVSTGTNLPSGNSFTAAIGGHHHYNYGFTAPGLYDVTFQVSGTLANGGGPVTGSGVYTFGVFTADDDYPFLEPPATPYSYEGRTFGTVMYYDAHVDMGVELIPVPEPGTVAIAMLGLAGVVGTLRYRRGGKTAPRGQRRQPG